MIETTVHKLWRIPNWEKPRKVVVQLSGRLRRLTDVGKVNSGGKPQPSMFAFLDLDLLISRYTVQAKVPRRFVNIQVMQRNWQRRGNKSREGVKAPVSLFLVDWSADDGWHIWGQRSRWLTAQARRGQLQPWQPWHTGRETMRGLDVGSAVLRWLWWVQLIFVKEVHRHGNICCS